MNVETMRSQLTNQMNLLHSKKGDPRTATAMATVCGKILGSIKLEMQYAKMHGITPTISFINAVKPQPKKIAKK